MSEKEQENFDWAGGGQGLEHLTGADLKTPYLKIAQKGTPEVDEDSPSYIKGLKPGDMFHVLSKENYGSKIVAIPLDWVRLWNEWDDKQFCGSHKPESVQVDKTVYSKWARVDNGHEIAETYNFLVQVEGHEADGPMVVALSGSAIADAKSWLADLNMSKVPDGKGGMQKANLFVYKWELSTERNENDAGVWWRFGKGKVSTIKPLGMITREYFLASVQENLALAKSMKIVPQLEAPRASGVGQGPVRTDM